ncbi:GNAT family N-acetyltransferase [Antrihabitans sp. YC2-6]|uniref:GNAT family N-acetyltransferase n=1 Tax=Antrihabitans sp. YC2-6 TaxID=2799498 RepID=UPI0018F42497|nr:GNAT family N-acetyltransferase [Antrihabitans sp. YC2-6]MBJ8343269.1 GNAT family N-acetyltransferase [Antrihabitans sp. YC2-6]
MLKLLGARQLGSRDEANVLRVLDADPVASCMVAARVEEFGLNPSMFPGELWSRGGPSESLCYTGANLVPLRGDSDDLRAFAERASRGPRMCSSIVGRRELAMPLWELLEDGWGPARELRFTQPLLAIARPSVIAADTLVRNATAAELDPYLSAAIEMFIEEVGVDPRSNDGGGAYRRRVAHLIATKRAWARIENGEVIFKAEVGALSRTVGQIQGVWVHPSYRGHGIGAAGTAAVVNAIIASGRTASLYVNDFNRGARRAYERVGFTQIATFSTVLLD